MVRGRNEKGVRILAELNSVYPTNSIEKMFLGIKMTQISVFKCEHVFIA